MRQTKLARNDHTQTWHISTRIDITKSSSRKINDPTPLKKCDLIEIFPTHMQCTHNTSKNTMHANAHKAKEEHVESLGRCSGRACVQKGRAHSLTHCNTFYALLCVLQSKTRPAHSPACSQRAHTLVCSFALHLHCILHNHNKNGARNNERCRIGGTSCAPD